MPIVVTSKQEMMRQAFQAWRNWTDNLQKEALQAELEKYQNDPRYAAVGKNLSQMNKAELVEAARRECDLSLEGANRMLVPALRALLRMKRKGQAIESDPMMSKPKGLTSMKKDALIAQAKSRSLTPDMINSSKKEWNKLTREELIMGIGDHVEYLSNRETAILNPQTPTSSSANMNEISSEEEFMDVRLEESPPPNTANRRKR